MMMFTIGSSWALIGISEPYERWTWPLVAAVGRAVAPELLSREWIPGLVVAAAGRAVALELLSREMSPV